DQRSADEQHAYLDAFSGGRVDESSDCRPQTAVDDRRKLGGDMKNSHTNASSSSPALPSERVDSLRDHTASSRNRSPPEHPRSQTFQPNIPERHLARMCLHADKAGIRILRWRLATVGIGVDERRRRDPVQPHSIPIATDLDLVEIPTAGDEPLA